MASFITPLVNPIRLQTRSLKLICSSFSTSKPSKRKNYLRQKLLKTLDPNSLVPESTTVKSDIATDSSSEMSPESPSSQLSCPNDEPKLPKESETDEFRQSETSSSASVKDDALGNFPETSVFNIVMCVVGVFVFQTIVSVWMLRSTYSGNKDEEEVSEGEIRDLELLIDGTSNSKTEFSLNDSENLFNRKLEIHKDEILIPDESDFDKKIAEIRLMARDAREKEGVKLKESGVEDEDNGDDEEEDDNEDYDDDDIIAKSGIVKEVDNKLEILTKRLKKNHRKPIFSGSDLIKDGNDKDGLDAKISNDALMYKKKYKSRGFSPDPSDKPRGFQGSKNVSGEKLKSKLIERMDEMLKVESSGYNEMPIDDLVEEEGRGARRSEPLIGDNQLKTQNPQGFTQEKQDTVAVPYKSNVLTKGNFFNGNRKQGQKVGKKKVNSSDPWWFSLQHALVILISGNAEGPDGLYMFNEFSDEKGESLYTVAFENPVDANNFCYILQTSFEYMEEFSADVLPLPIKELVQEVESDRMMKVLFVKKGKLKLYAGQPLEEVENALRCLI